MSDSLRGNVLVVTGGASGIGLAVCRRFGREGAKVVLLDMNVAEAMRQTRVLQETGMTAEAFECDVSRQEDCLRVIGAVIERYGGIDILMNNAGLTQRSAFVDTECRVYEKVMAVNFFGALYCTKAAINSLLERRGTIVVTSSHAGYSPLFGRTGYSASKHALHGLFESLRTELVGQGVHVMMLCPGFTKTNLQEARAGWRRRRNEASPVAGRFGRHAGTSRRSRIPGCPETQATAVADARG